MSAKPTIHELGTDLLQISPLRRWISLALPFAWFAGYWPLAAQGYWALAVAFLVALSFVTYGSVSHDLVHRTLGLNRRANDLFLIVIELLALRSGTAYRLAHLHHHSRYPADDDVEGAAARMSLIGSLFEGVRFQPKLFCWSWRMQPRHRRQLGFELAIIGAAYLTSLLMIHLTIVPIVYTVLMTVGAWTIPLITSYLPHNPAGEDELHQTRAFRGKLLSIVALEHLYHLEHHLYPAVPHQNWPRLARRLDSFLSDAGVQPARLFF